jgi:hypothetical protein
MDEVKLGSVLERLRDMKVFSYLGIDGRILFIPPIYDGVEVSASHGISGSKQGHIPVARHEPFSDVARDRLPGAVMARRCSPSHGRQDSYPFAGDLHASWGSS